MCALEHTVIAKWNCRGESGISTLLLAAMLLACCFLASTMESCCDTVACMGSSEDVVGREPGTLEPGGAPALNARDNL